MLRGGESGVGPRNRGERRVDAVLFDCDGVLVDSERVAVECIVEFAARFGARFELEEALQRFTGARMADNLREIEARGKCKLPDDFEDTLRTHMAAEFETRIEPLPVIVVRIDRVNAWGALAAPGSMPDAERPS